MTLLDDLYAFSLEHRRCGDLDVLVRAVISRDCEARGAIAPEDDVPVISTRPPSTLALMANARLVTA